ncbi:MAG: AI-2E family transporter [Candidatus Eisenbacteria bacterium]|nr:AI-2E family transporter [Candidatus Eisenbacteria bacterium]
MAELAARSGRRHRRSAPHGSLWQRRPSGTLASSSAIDRRAGRVAMANNDTFTHRLFVVVAVVTATVVVLLILKHIASVLLLGFAAILLAIILDAYVTRMQKLLRMPRIVSLLVGLLVLVGLLGVLIYALGPRLAQQAGQLQQRIPEAIEQLRSLLAEQSWSRGFAQRIPEDPTIDDLLPQGSNILGQIAGVFSTVFGGVASTFLIILLGFYIAWRPSVYVDNLVRLFPARRHERTRQVLDGLGRALRMWLIGQVSAMAVVGVLTAAGLMLIGMPLAIVLALIAALLAFVPLVGPVLAAIPAVLLAFAKDVRLALWVIVVYAVVQFIESNFITPMIQRRAISLPPAVLLLAQAIMGILFGVVGVFLGTPLAVAVIVLVQMLYVEDVLDDEVRPLGVHGKRR